MRDVSENSSEEKQDFKKQNVLMRTFRYIIH